MDGQTLTDRRLVAVMKIGGGILRRREDYERVAALVRQRSGRRNVLVVSAANGVTDSLLAVLTQAQTGAVSPDYLQAIRGRHDDLVRGTPFEAEARVVLDSSFQVLSSTLDSACDLDPLAARADVASFGEKLSCRLMALFLQAADVPAVSMLSDEAGIFADALYDNSSCDLERTKSALRERLPTDRAVVLPGFYGVDLQGRAHLFGRGGSDYSAGCVAACLDADILEMWKDVDGFMTADPRRIASARLIEQISFDEARELGFFGAKIIHPRTFEPMRGHRTRVRIHSLQRPDAPGTRIVEHGVARGRPVCLSEKRDVALFSITGGGMVESVGVLGSVFGALKDAGVSVDLISTGVSEVSFSMSQHQAPAALQALEQLKATDGSLFEHVEVEDGLSNVALVGQDALSAGVLARAFSVVDQAGLSPLAVSCARSRISLSFIVAQAHGLACLSALHRAFFEPSSVVPASTAKASAAFS